MPRRRRERLASREEIMTGARGIFRGLLRRPEGSVERALRRLARARRGPGAARQARRDLDLLSRLPWPGADALFRAHESALFLRAYPHDAATLRSAEGLLSGVAGRVAALERSGADLSALDTPETSGIAGTTVTAAFTRDLVRWLASRCPGRLWIDWEGSRGDDLDLHGAGGGRAGHGVGRAAGRLPAHWSGLGRKAP